MATTEKTYKKASIKRNVQEKPKYTERRIKLKKELWEKAESYTRYAELVGTNSEKLEWLLEQLLLEQFEQDKEGFEAFLEEEQKKEAEHKAKKEKKEQEEQELKKKREQASKELDSAPFGNKANNKALNYKKH